jgi:hypothetical protein
MLSLGREGVFCKGEITMRDAMPRKDVSQGSIANEGPAQPIANSDRPASGAAQPQRQGAPEEPDPEETFLRVEKDVSGHARLRVIEGPDTLKLVALNPAGFDALIEADLMRKPQSLKVGALHNWVELDGELFRLDGGSDRTTELEETLNERYVAENGASQVQNVSIFANAASPTGFDIQFPAASHGLGENRRRHLDAEALEVLRDREKCCVLRKGIVVVLAPPLLVFKRRHSNGNETHLPAGPRTVVKVPGEQGQTREIDLSEGVDLLRLNDRELAAVFNHPAVNRRAALAAAARHRENSATEGFRAAA